VKALARALQTNGQTPKDLFTHVDVTRTGKLSRTKFALALDSIKNFCRPRLYSDDVTQLFKFFDKSKNSEVSRQEFCSTLINALKASNDQRSAVNPGCGDSGSEDETSFSVRGMGVARPKAKAMAKQRAAGAGVRTPAAGLRGSSPAPGGRGLSPRPVVGGRVDAGRTVGGLGHVSAPAIDAGDQPPRDRYAGTGVATRAHESGGLADRGDGLGGRHGGARAHGISPESPGVGRSGGARAHGSSPESPGAGRYGGARAHGSSPESPGAGRYGGARAHGSSPESPGASAARHSSHLSPSGMHRGGGASPRSTVEATPDFTQLSAADLEKPLLKSEGEDSGSGRMSLYRGSYDWLRKGNGGRARDLRLEAALQTWAACQHGGYDLDGNPLHLEHVDAMVNGTSLLEYERAKDMDLPSTSFETVWSRYPPGMAVNVAVDKAQEGHNVAIVNAASAYHAGGGFTTGGRHALEESLCMQTTLSKSLFAAADLARAKKIEIPEHVRPSGPKYGSAWDVHIPYEGVIFSPHVEVFREGTFQGYPFLEQPVKLSVVSVAMPNGNDRIRDAPVDMPPDREEYLSLVHKKLYTLAAACVQAGVTHLVMVDAGCGVYSNEATDVGEAFGKLIYDSFPSSFAEIALSSSKSFADAVESVTSGTESALPLNSATGRKLCKIFNYFDLDEDGVITREELGMVLQNLDDRDEETDLPKYWDDDRIDTLMTAMDIDGDGSIKYEMFAEWISGGEAPEMRDAFLGCVGDDAAEG